MRLPDAVHVQLADVADVGQAHQLGDLGSDLAGLGVAAVASADDEIGGFAPESQRQGLGRGQGVAAGQGAVGEQDAAVGAQGVALGQALSGVGRAHGQGDYGVLGVGLEVDGHVDAEKVEGVDLGRYALALDYLVLVVELDAGHHGNELDADRDFHRIWAPWRTMKLRRRLAGRGSGTPGAGDSR